MDLQSHEHQPLCGFNHLPTNYTGTGSVVAGLLFSGGIFLFPGNIKDDMWGKYNVIYMTVSETIWCTSSICISKQGFWYSTKLFKKIDLIITKQWWNSQSLNHIFIHSSLHYFIYRLIIGMGLVSINITVNWTPLNSIRPFKCPSNYQLDNNIQITSTLFSCKQVRVYIDFLCRESGLQWELGHHGNEIRQESGWKLIGSDSQEYVLNGKVFTLTGLPSLVNM